jgi:hypothetical protein
MKSKLNKRYKGLQRELAQAVDPMARRELVDCMNRITRAMACRVVAPGRWRSHNSLEAKSRG